MHLASAWGLTMTVVGAQASESATALASAQIDPDIEEVRVAMALNGGVSLAVWMGGCAAELDCARRAHIDPAEVGDGYGAVYHVLCEVFSRELVIDIMSGSSAGGINGAMLAAVSARGRRIDPSFLRKRWIELAELSQLLQPLQAARPASVMRGDSFHEGLLETFEGLLGSAADPAANAASELPEGMAPQELLPVLNVTTTDLTGSELEFSDTWKEKLSAREYRACFKFRERDDFTAQNLAGASRASASFPVAFEPWLVRDAELRRLGGFTGPRWVVDGGLLDNAPIRLALDAIPTRSAVRQVKRFVCYVNPEPPELLKQAPDQAAEPPLAHVLGAVVNLPRKAPFADQLKALERATQEGMLNEDAEIPLLKLELGCLHNSAEALLDAYRSRRRLRSLIDLLGQPAMAEAAFDRLGADCELPWIPTSMSAPQRGKWGWGILAALRVQYLMLDLVGRAIRHREGRSADRALLTARKQIFERVDELRERQATFLADLCVIRRLEAIADPHSDLDEELDALAAYVWARDSRIYAGIERTAQTILEIAPLLNIHDGLEVGPALFGEPIVGTTLSDAMLARFLERVLAIEVVRRAFSAEEEVSRAQPIAFAQLTPYAPTPLLSRAPFSEESTMTPEKKLTGLVLGHFGGFYRRSWRANDFMWGRLDSAMRIVSLLIDTHRAGVDAAARIAGMLVEKAAGQEWLLEEALVDAAALVPGEAPLDLDRLRELLTDVLDRDLARDGERTRVLCALVAQLEILQTELPSVLTEAAEDEKLGSAPNELALPSEQELEQPGGIRAAIESLRDGLSQPDGKTLPRRLGVGDADERTSDLAMRTIAHAGLVILSMLRTGRAPLAKPLQLARAIVLPMAGAVAEHWYNRLALWGAFSVAAMALTARFVTIPKCRAADLHSLSWSAALITVIALLVVAGTVVVPIYRAARGGTAGKAVQFGWAAALLGVGALAPILLATLSGGLNLAQLAVQPGAKNLPTAVTALILLIVLGTWPAARQLRGRVEKLAEAAWSPALLLATFVVVVLLGAWALIPLIHAIAYGAAWKLAAALVVLAGAPIVGGCYLFLRAPLDRRLHVHR
jgi:predicted acylesterase/phospholipase RssA